jgi:hypothetical protein
MKKLIALVICAVMVLSMLPVMTLTASAAVEGDWITTRAPGDYADDESYTPAAGYSYTSEGFQTISPDYSGTTPYQAIRRKDADNLKEGLHLELRIDDFAYKGEDGTRDEWISIALWDRQMMTPGNLNYGSGWLCLIRGAGEGSASVQSFWTEPNNEDGVGGTFSHTGDVGISPTLDENGRETYVLDVTYTNGTYEIKINDTVISGMSTISSKLNEMTSTGDVWLSIVTRTGEAGTPLAMTILNFNGNTPTGDDSQEPEENVNTVAEIADPSTVPANTPCFLWDASDSTHGSNVGCGDMSVAAQGDNSYLCTPASSTAVYITASIKKSISYSADDFPVVAMLLRNYEGGDGNFWYCAGDVMAAQDTCITSWFAFPDDEVTFTYGDNDEYMLVTADLTDMWTGRINSIRLQFNSFDLSDPEASQFDLMWMGCFRSIEEAQTYASTTLSAQGVNVGSSGDETEESATTGEQETAAPTTGNEEVTIPAVTETAAVTGEQSTSAGTDADSTVTTDTTNASGSGCASVVGGAAVVLMAAAAAGVALKKKH